MTDLFVERCITVEFLADAAASQPDPRAWLARLAGDLVGVVAEMQRDRSAPVALQATVQRAEISEIMDEVAETLDRILEERAEKR